MEGTAADTEAAHAHTAHDDAAQLRAQSTEQNRSAEEKEKRGDSDSDSTNTTLQYTTALHCTSSTDSTAQYCTSAVQYSTALQP